MLGLIPTPCTTDNRIADALSISYQTAPMEEDYYINGPMQADIWMATTASDASLSVRISDVSPSGAAVPLSNGLQAVSFRKVDESRSRKLDGQSIQPWHPFTADSVLPVTPNEPVLVPVEIFTTSAVVAKGHSLRVSIGPSNLPQGIPSLPTLLQSLLGTITIYNDAKHPSSLVLPIVPPDELL
ncbi:MAG: hypothetical protein KBT56_08635 [Paraperlucidibaca sp.]|nr:hypothetical protein [Paraperlucidibaca sp.]